MVAAAEGGSGGGGGRRAGSGGRRPSARPLKRRGRAAVVTMDQKLDVAAAELDAARKETAAMRALAARTLNKLRALLQQADARIGGLKREAFEFKRAVVVGGEHAVTGRIRAERVVNYYVDAARRKDTAVEQLRLRQASLTAALAKAAASQARKDELSGSGGGGGGDGSGDGGGGGAAGSSSSSSSSTLHFIDYLQLRIENKQLAGRLDERNAELVRLKVSAGASLRRQNGYKARLGELVKAAARLRGEIRARCAVLRRVTDEHAAVAGELAGLRATAGALARTAQLAQEGGGGGSGSGRLDLPTTLDYMTLLALERELTREAGCWDRKVEVAQLAAANARTRAAAAAATGGGEPPAPTARPGWQPTGTGVSGALPRGSDAGASALKVGGFPAGAASPQRWSRTLPQSAAVAAATTVAPAAAAVTGSAATSAASLRLGRAQPAVPSAVSPAGR
jgi:hypothetical protein